MSFLDKLFGCSRSERKSRELQRQQAEYESDNRLYPVTEQGRWGIMDIYKTKNLVHIYDNYGNFIMSINCIIEEYAYNDLWEYYYYHELYDIRYKVDAETRLYPSGDISKYWYTTNRSDVMKNTHDIREIKKDQSKPYKIFAKLFTEENENSDTTNIILRDAHGRYLFEFGMAKIIQKKHPECYTIVDTFTERVLCTINKDFVE